MESVRDSMDPATAAQVSGSFALAVHGRLVRLVNIYTSDCLIMPSPSMDWMFITLRRGLLETVRESPSLAGLDLKVLDVAVPASLTTLDPLVFGEIWDESLRPLVDEFGGSLLRQCSEAGINPFQVSTDWLFRDYLRYDVAMDEYSSVKRAGVKAFWKAVRKGKSLRGCEDAAGRAAYKKAMRLQPRDSAGTAPDNAAGPRTRGRKPKLTMQMIDEAACGLADRYGDVPTDEAIAELLGVDRTTVYRTRRRGTETASPS